MKKNIIFILKIVLLNILVLISIYLFKELKSSDLVPTKYMNCLLIVLIVSELLISLFILLKNKILNILGFILSIAIVVVFCFAMRHIDNVSKFINQAFDNSDVETTEYYVLVLNDGTYNELKDLENKSLGYIELDDNKEDSLNHINNKIQIETKAYNEMYTLYKDLLSNKIDSIIISEGFLDMLEDDHKDLKEKTKVIYSFEIENKIETDDVTVEELKPVNILISGSDSRSGKILAKTRSDVNMIMTIDPINHKILLTSIPRDYYVQLHGTKGNKDKLTHSGIYGIDMTKNTIEDLFDIKIDYTIKVGFNSLVGVVDAIGGIDIESDQTIKTYHIKDNIVYKGMNHFDGEHALEYARERYAYKTGDNHRVQNQQQVLEAIINKICSDKSLLKDYDKILVSLSSLYKTDIPSSYIKLIIKNQLNNMETWSIDKQQLSGSGATLPTYSMPGVKLWVMQPDMYSIKEASEKIKNYIE